MPYVVSGLVAAGGLAAALSTADGLLLTIANALSHDLYYKMIDPNAPTARRVSISKGAARRRCAGGGGRRVSENRRTSCSCPAAFSLAGDLLPAAGARHLLEARQQVGASRHDRRPGTTFYYMATTQPWLRSVFGVTSPTADHVWWGILADLGGLFGVPVGIVVIIVVSLLTGAAQGEQELVEHVRYPDLKLARA